MDIRILRYFIAIAKEKNITKAAQSLYIFQPALHSS
ncbi:LysR family transcriptional regulator [Leptotrichia sp. oral taxon 212]